MNNSTMNNCTMNNSTMNNCTMNNSTMNNCTMNTSDDIPGYRTIHGVFFILISIFSFTGNGLLLCVLLVYENLKNVTNLFVFNLAFSDLIFTITLPFWTVQLLHQWVFGDICCKLMTTGYFVGVYSSVIILTAMTVDRFMTVVLNYWQGNPIRRQRFTIGACTAAWVISLAASISDASIVNAETLPCGLILCKPPSNEIDLGYYLQSSLLFFLPFVIIVFCYSAILKTVLQASNRKRHRTVVVVLCIVAAFFICWGPYHIMLLIPSCNDFCVIEIISKLLAYSHCSMNPLLYMLSQKWRKHLLHLLHCDKVWRKNRVKGRSPSTTVYQISSSLGKTSADMLELQ